MYVIIHLRNLSFWIDILFMDCLQELLTFPRSLRSDQLNMYLRLFLFTNTCILLLVLFFHLKVSMLQESVYRPLLIYQQLTEKWKSN